MDLYVVLFQYCYSIQSTVGGWDHASRHVLIKRRLTSSQDIQASCSVCFSTLILSSLLSRTISPFIHPMLFPSFFFFFLKCDSQSFSAFVLNIYKVNFFFKKAVFVCCFVTFITSVLYTIKMQIIIQKDFLSPHIFILKT